MIQLPPSIALLFFALWQSPLTPAEMGVAAAQREAAQHPGDATSYNDLACALVLRARETRNKTYLQKAQDALSHSFGREPLNYGGRRSQVLILLARQQYKEALQLATELNRKMPDDLQVRGEIADAAMALGDYGAALKSAQWMLNLRPGNIEGLSRGAALREVFGDLPGAIEMATSAYTAMDPNAVSERALLLSRLAHLYLLSKELSRAEQLASDALALVPSDSDALAALVVVRMAQQRNADAVQLAKQAYAAAPCASNLYQLACVLMRSGDAILAREYFKRFEKTALDPDATPDENGLLARYYVDHSITPAKALAFARKQRADRRDVDTLDCYAWALAESGRYVEADGEIQLALKLGTKEPTVLYHAGRIALWLGQKEAGNRYVQEAKERYSVEALDWLAKRDAARN